MVVVSNPLSPALSQEHGESLLTTPQKVSPMHSLPFSPSQFLNSPNLSFDTNLTSTPVLGTLPSSQSTPLQHPISSTSNVLRTSSAAPSTTCTPPNAPLASSSSSTSTSVVLSVGGQPRTPKSRRALLQSAPKTPTPLKNALREIEKKSGPLKHLVRVCCGFYCLCLFICFIFSYFRLCFSLLVISPYFPCLPFILLLFVCSFVLVSPYLLLSCSSFLIFPCFSSLPDLCFCRSCCLSFSLISLFSSPSFLSFLIFLFCFSSLSSFPPYCHIFSFSSSISFPFSCIVFSFSLVSIPFHLL